MHLDDSVCPAWLQIHEATIAAGAYPSPLNYYSFPKSVCTSVNEVHPCLKPSCSAPPVSPSSIAASASVALHRDPACHMVLADSAQI